MKVEIVSSEEFSIFVNSLYAKITDYSDREEIIGVVKDIIAKYKNKLKLRGFYKIKVYLDERVGLFLDGVRLECLERLDAIDLRVIVYFDEDIYFKTDDYFVISDVSKIIYFDGNYYCKVKDILDINKVVEFGEFVYGNYILDILDKGSLI